MSHLQPQERLQTPAEQHKEGLTCSRQRRAALTGARRHISLPISLPSAFTQL